MEGGLTPVQTGPDSIAPGCETAAAKTRHGKNPKGMREFAFAGLPHPRRGRGKPARGQTFSRMRAALPVSSRR